MKPRTKLEKLVTELSGKLPAITKEQEDWAKKHLFDHFAYKCKDELWCSECGKMWVNTSKDKLGDKIECPYCHHQLDVKVSRKQKIHEEGADRAAGQRLLEMAGANIEVHIAPETLDRTADNEMKLLGERLSRSGLTVEQHCKNSHTTPEALRQRYRDEAESRARVMLAARAIAEAEQIVVHPEEVNAEYRRLAALQETPEAEIRKVLTEDAVAAALAAKKVQRFLLDHAEVTSVTDSAEKE